MFLEIKQLLENSFINFILGFLPQYWGLFVLHISLRASFHVVACASCNSCLRNATIWVTCLQALGTLLVQVARPALNSAAHFWRNCFSAVFVFVETFVHDKAPCNMKFWGQ